MFGYFHRYFLSYLASNDQSSFSGSLPSNESDFVPSSLPSHSPHSRPSSFPEYSADSLETNVPSFLGKYEESCDARRGSVQMVPEAAGCGGDPVLRTRPGRRPLLSAQLFLAETVTALALTRLRLHLTRFSSGRIIWAF